MDILIWLFPIIFIAGYMICHHVMLRDWEKDIDERNKNFLRILKDKKRKEWVERFKVITESK